ncbi:BtrH N-terminal domain-containing protein [Trichloromonas sp.]|uniref:BtrH N-terminal domain-containing protein n=1 Tax=Trichloromonas sp. TaxID=3069249 RepID=UPI003D814AC1
MTIDFKHRQYAHCESGAIASLLQHRGVEISEALAFGIGGGLFFGYLPFIKLNQLPLITYRKGPGDIFKSATKRLGVGVERFRFRSPEKAMAALDRALDQGIPVGVQTSVYWLPYLPPALRFHFNAHNLVVYGKQGDDYLVSDPVMDEAVLCPAADLQRARFAEGDLAPKGRMYYLGGIPEQLEMKPAVVKGINEVCRSMVRNPIPLLGVKGIRRLARVIEGWPQKLGQRKSLQHLGHVIRMQEEIGTGGGGFRFMYSAFLQEAAGITGDARFAELAVRMTDGGDRWREFALLGARVCKRRPGTENAFPQLANLLRDCADHEEQVFRDLARVLR